MTHPIIDLYPNSNSSPTNLTTLTLPSTIQVQSRLTRNNYYVSTGASDNALLKQAQQMVLAHHYSRGGSNTAVYVHGLFERATDALVGIAWWLPPTRVAAESVNRADWQQVLVLTRLVILPGTPSNACTYLLGRAIRDIWSKGRFCSLVTYADESQGHEGGIYAAGNWLYVGRTGPYQRWIDPMTGRQVAAKSTKNRVKAEMLALGFIKAGRYYKHKFVLHDPRLKIDVAGVLSWRDRVKAGV